MYRIKIIKKENTINTLCIGLLIIILSYIAFLVVIPLINKMLGYVSPIIQRSMIVLMVGGMVIISLGIIFPYLESILYDINHSDLAQSCLEHWNSSSQYYIEFSYNESKLKDWRDIIRKYQQNKYVPKTVKS